MTAKCLPGQVTQRTAIFLFAVAVAFVSCSKSGGSNTIGPPTLDTTQPELLRMEHGRIADVYGLKASSDGTTIELFERDVMIGPDITDQRTATEDTSDNEITYDFLSADPDTLQPVLLIPRLIDSPAFREAFDRLDDNLRTITAMDYTDWSPGTPFSVVPRNAAIRLTFSAPLEINDGFFVSRDETGYVTGLRNTQAVQLLRIVGDPEQPNAFVPQPTRVIVRERTLVLDPVLLGTEGTQYLTTNNASGMPASSDQIGANFRVAVALDGPLAIPGLRESEDRGITGFNNSGVRSIVRDFRTGNSDDTSSDMARGFVRDPLPLRIVGEIPMLLERVDVINEFTQEITVFKNGLDHEIDRGDVFQVATSESAVPIRTEVVSDPVDDRDDSEVQHVRVRVRRVAKLEELDPSNDPDYPSDLETREQWLAINAPIASCVCEYTAGGVEQRDDPRNFLVFIPTPLQIGDYRPAPDEFVSPYASAVVRFTKPVDLDTVKWADTFFFAMRDLTNEDLIEEFIQERPNNAGGIGMAPGTFNRAKYRTPFLVDARLVDETGSQTQLLLRPTFGFYLDAAMRDPDNTFDYSYYLHLISDSPEGGISDLAGNRVDLQGSTAERSNSIVIPFTLDTRLDDNGDPLFDDNLAISIVRRNADPDEDENPSYFLADEVQAPNAPQRAAARPVDDLFGAFLYLDGRMIARPTTRQRLIADDFNQQPVVQQPDEEFPQDARAWCPQMVYDPSPQFQPGDELQIASNTATILAGGAVQNPMNPYGSRLQTCWREIDMSLSRDNPFDFNLDIEQMYWAPFRGAAIQYDEFDRMSMWLGHSEYRPLPCIGDFSALPSLPDSGLQADFERNYLWNPLGSGSGDDLDTQAPRQAAFTDANLQILATDVIRPENGQNAFLPLPEFREPYFVWRDETVREQGGQAGIGSDLTTNSTGPIGNTFAPHVVSPFLMGQGRRITDRGDEILLSRSYWNDAQNRPLLSPNSIDAFTGGLCGSIAMPLLADIWTYCDTELAPEGHGFIASGSNGWQTALTVQSDPRPNFRVFSAGRPAAAPQGGLCVSPSDPAWGIASGGWGPGASQSAPWTQVPTLNGQPTFGDNTFYWIMMDVTKRQSVATAGFIDLNNPHRVPPGFEDTRLGPYFLADDQSTVPSSLRPAFSYGFDPPLSRMPEGTEIVPQFRGASIVDELPWYWDRWINTENALWPAPTDDRPSLTLEQRQQMRPDSTNFPLDPRKAGDAHLRKWDSRPMPGGGGSRNWWTYLYNRTVTTYVDDANELMDEEFCDQFQGPNETFTPRDIRYVNWRFVMRNNVTASPPIQPFIDTFSLSYKFAPR